MYGSVFLRIISEIILQKSPIYLLQNCEFTPAAGGKSGISIDFANAMCYNLVTLQAAAVAFVRRQRQEIMNYDRIYQCSKVL